jgi:hypothetical protein
VTLALVRATALTRPASRALALVRATAFALVRAATLARATASAPAAFALGPTGLRRARRFPARFRSDRATFTGPSRRRATALATATAVAIATSDATVPATPATALAVSATAAIAAATLGTRGALLDVTRRATWTRLNANAERTAADSEEAARTLLHRGDHHFRTAQAERLEPLAYGLFQGFAFEDSALRFHHGPLVVPRAPCVRAGPAGGGSRPLSGRGAAPPRGRTADQRPAAA